MFTFARMKKTMYAICAALLLSCGAKEGKTTDAEMFEIDSVKVDSTLSLAADSAAPKCEVSIMMQYMKGKNADSINNGILRSGLLIPECFTLSDEKMSMKEAVDSFVNAYLADYKQMYGKLYAEDKEHSESLNCQYNVRAKAQFNVNGVLTYVAEIYNYGGGAHGISQTIVKNFDTESGKLLSVADFFRPGYEQDLKDLVIKKLLKKFEAKDIDELADEKYVFADHNVYVPDNFIPTDDGFTFIYCSDEIAPHYIGEIRIDVKKSEVERLLPKQEKK